MTFLQVGADMATVDPFQGAEIDGMDPISRNKTAQQIRYHLVMREEQFIAVVVVHRPPVTPSMVQYRGHQSVFGAVP
jgi:hypothetical protein